VILRCLPRFEEPLPKEDGAWESATGGSASGFTYELLEELEGKFKLSDFLGSTEARDSDQHDKRFTQMQD
jgi:hypothetical protein